MPNIIVNRRAVFGGSEWLPTKMRDLAIWLRPDFGITKDGSNNVSQWNFKNGTFRGASNVAQATGANQPLWVATHASYNGRPVLGFSSANDYMDSATFSSVLAQPSTFFVVGNFGTLVGGMGQAFFDATASGNRNLIFLRDVTPNTNAIFAGTIVAGSNANANVHIFDTAINGASSNLFIDGTSDISGNANTQGLSSLRIGANITPGFFLTGNIAEIIIYSALLNAAERTKVGQYLSKRYAITIS